MAVALYPGSFDPVTMGHVDITARGAALFERVIVAVYSTPSKNLLFTTEERVQLFKEAVRDMPNVEVREFNGLVVRFAKEVGADVIIRGLRSGADFEYEYDMAFMNQKLEPTVDMVSFMSSLEYMFVSSSLLKEVARLGGDVTGMVPPHVVEAVKTKYGLPVSEA